MLILLRFSVTDYRKQRHRKSRLQKQKRQKREDWKPTRHILWREKVTRKISGRRERTTHSSSHYRKRRQHYCGVSFICWSQIIPRSRTLGRLVLPYARSGLATEWFSKRRWDSTARTVSRPKCSDENGSDSETTNQLLHIKQKLSYRILSCEFSVFAIRPIPYCGIDVYILCMFISCVCSLHWQTYGMHCTKI